MSLHDFPLFLFLTWVAMLSMTKVKLDLISDVSMYLFFEKDMRGGVIYISKRYSKANKKYLTCYNPKKPMKYIAYLDKNNLYGYTMSKSLQQVDLKGWTS